MGDVGESTDAMEREDPIKQESTIQRRSMQGGHRAVRETRKTNQFLAQHQHEERKQRTHGKNMHTATALGEDGGSFYE